MFNRGVDVFTGSAAGCVKCKKGVFEVFDLFTWAAAAVCVKCKKGVLEVFKCSMGQNGTHGKWLESGESNAEGRTSNASESGGRRTPRVERRMPGSGGRTRVKRKKGVLQVCKCDKPNRDGLFLHLKCDKANGTKGFMNF